MHKQLRLQEKMMTDFLKKDLHADDNALMWKSGEKKEAYRCAIFSVDTVERESRDGSKKGSFVSLRCPDWIVVIPVFRDEKGALRVIVEKQYRHGSDSVIIEYPAGLVEAGEDPAAAAERELLEETGFKAGRIIHIVTLFHNNAFMSFQEHYYLALDLEQSGHQDLDANEEIDVFCPLLEDAVALMGTESADNALMMAATLLLMRSLEKEKV